MANTRRMDRVRDTDVMRLNYAGYSHKAIAVELNCHPATVTQRLQALGVKPTDTRRSFMEQVIKGLTQDERDWLTSFLFTHEIPIADFVTQAIKEAYTSNSSLVAAPLESPELLEVALILPDTVVSVPAELVNHDDFVDELFEEEIPGDVD